jgi:hypothetical protein
MLENSKVADVLAANVPSCVAAAPSAAASLQLRLCFVAGNNYNKKLNQLHCYLQLSFVATIGIAAASVDAVAVADLYSLCLQNYGCDLLRTPISKAMSLGHYQCTSAQSKWTDTMANSRRKMLANTMVSEQLGAAKH